MTSTAAKTAREVLRELDAEEILARRNEQIRALIRQRRIARLDQLWRQRALLSKFTLAGAAVSLAIVLTIPSRFVSTARLVPPDPLQGQRLALFSALAGRLGANLSAIGSDLLGLRTS